MDLRCPENGAARAVSAQAGGDSSGFGEARLTLLACGASGYANLLGLASLAHADRRRWGIVGREAVAERAGGLIALSGGREGEIGRALLRGDAAGGAPGGRRLGGPLPGALLHRVRAHRPAR